MTELSREGQLLTALQQSATIIQNLEQRLAKYSAPLAVIGMACRFPAADTPEEFWQLLQTGRDLMTEIPRQRWPVDDYYDPVPGTPGKSYVREAAFLQQVDQFDPQFFGISPREATSLDPQQRLLLEVAWEALERAGQAPHQLRNSQTGVWIGMMNSDYRELEADLQVTHTYAATGTGFCFASGRLSYLLGMQGPNMVIDTACSASLVAIHLACQSLRTGESNLALAGGVNLILSPWGHVNMAQMQALAPDGRCKAFAAAADGYNRGEGCGVVVLKRLSDAIAAQDPILAVIRGSAVNHDGPSSGLTVPNAAAQRALIRQALASGQVEADEVAYVDAHGTGTALGDPIEVQGLLAAYGVAQRRDPLLIGSVKTNIGHLESAAGIASLFKVILAMQHNEIPPQLHFKTPSPHIDWPAIPIQVVSERTPWPGAQPGQAGPARKKLAGVSSFGLGGTNAHLIVEEAPITPNLAPATPVDRGYQLLTLSAKSEAALVALAQRYHQFLPTATAALAEICYTAQSGRNHFEHRLAIIGQDVAQMQQALACYIKGETLPLVRAGYTPDHQAPAKIAFLFTGQGSQYLGMGRELYATEPIFRAIIDRCDRALVACLGRSLLDLLYPAAHLHQHSEHDLLESHPCAQAANFALECALADLWRSWGVEPEIVLGHSLGDFAAAYTAGIFTLEDGLRLVVERGRLMACAVGSMVAVLAAENEVAPFLAPFPDLSLAVINGPQSVVLSGGQASVDAVTQQLQTAGFKVTKLAIPVAAHSPLLDPVLEAFEEAVRNTPRSSPTLQVISSMSGKLVAAELTEPHYWRQHLRNPVRFAAGVATLLAQDCDVLLELGPKPTLLGIVPSLLEMNDGDQPHAVSKTKTAPKNPLLLPSLRETRPDRQQMLESLAELYVHGSAIDWAQVAPPATRRKVVLPTYPFQRQRYWVERSKQADSSLSNPLALSPLIDKVLQSPALKETLFETIFSVDALPFLREHRVYGQLVSPGACQLAMSLTAAALHIGFAQPLVLEHVVLPQPLVLAEKADQIEKRTVQTIFTPLAANTLNHQSGSREEFKVISFEPMPLPVTSATATPATEPQLHAIGTLATTTIPSPMPLNLVALQQRITEMLPPDDLYTTLRRNQIEMGPSFRWIAEIYRGATAAQVETLARLRVPGTVVDQTRYLLHPALLDACFQVAGMARNDVDTSATMLSFALATLTLYRPAQGIEWWCHAIQTDRYQWNITLADNTGELIAELIGFELRAAPPPAINSQAHWRDWLYQLTWQPLPALPPVPTPATFVPDQWLILADRQGVGDRLAAQLARHGQPVRRFYAGVNGSPTQNNELDPAALPGLLHLFQPDATNAFATKPGRLGVVYLWGLDATGPETVTTAQLAAEQQRYCGGLLQLTQSLIHQHDPAVDKIRLWVVTRGAQVVESAPGQATPPAVAVGQATLWGLGRVIAQEQPTLWGGLIDLDPNAQLAPSADAMWIEQEVLSDRSAANDQRQAATAHETQVAYRANQRYGARLTHLHPPSPQPSVGATMRADAWYLITGGLGALGLQVAGWLVEQGARHLFLLGRRGVTTPAQQARLAALEKQGAEIRIVQVDVADQTALADFFAHLTTAALPLRGILHTAGVTADALLQDQDWASFQAVLAAKVSGAWNLHLLTQPLTQQLPLDFFVTFSSMAAWLGPIGLSNYAAGNSFLDALAHYRRQQGLPALTINWGAWDEGGMATPAIAARLNRAGSQLMSPAQCLQALGHLLTTETTQIALAQIEWTQWLNSTLATQNPALFSQLTAATSGQASSRRSGDSIPNLPNSPVERYVPPSNQIEATLAQIWAEVLGFGQVGVEDEFFALGGDSLMATKVLSRIRHTFAIELSLATLFFHPTIAIQAEVIAEKCQNTQPAATSALDAALEDEQLWASEEHT